MHSFSTELPISFMGFEAIAIIDGTIYSPSIRPSGLYGPPEHYDPGCGADFSIDFITLSIESCFATTGALFKSLASLPEIYEAAERAADSTPVPDLEYDEDYYRGER